jgi:hypothetical protein
MNMLDLAAPALRRFCTLQVEVGPPRNIGSGPFGQRRVVPILGGRVSGPEISGTIIPGGADWQTVAADGLTELAAHYAFETDDGAVIEMSDSGIRRGPSDVMLRLAAGEPVPPTAYYMRSTVRLRSGHPNYAWLNGMVFVGTGGRNPPGVQIDLYLVE